MNEPRVEIVLLNWNGYEDTVECVESLKKITYKNWGMIIVDNASSGIDTKMLIQVRNAHLIINDKNLGFPGGCNVGMRYAMKKGADYIMLLNNDTIVAPDFLSKLVTTAEACKGVGIVASAIYYNKEPKKLQYIGGKINWLLGINNTYLCDEIDAGQYRQTIEQDYVPGTSCIIKREVIEKVGYLDEKYFFAIEEFDYCTRIKRAGYKVVLQPASMIWHKWQASGKKLPRYPETQKIIRQKAGFRAYKLWWRLYKSYSPPVLFVIPFLLQVLYVGPLITLMLRGKWKAIWNTVLFKVHLREEL